MHLNQNIERQLSGVGCKFLQLRGIKGGDDQEHAVRSEDTGLRDLVRVNHKILANDRQLTGCTRLLQKHVGTLKILFVCQHRQASGTMFGVVCSMPCRIKVLPDQTLGR